jgi:hypothetical protein
MLTRITLALAAVLVLASASMTPAASAARHNAPGWTEGGNTGFVPGSAAERAWFDRNTRSGGGF